MWRTINDLKTTCARKVDGSASVNAIDGPQRVQRSAYGLGGIPHASREASDDLANLTILLERCLDDGIDILFSARCRNYKVIEGSVSCRGGHWVAGLGEHGGRET